MHLRKCHLLQHAHKICLGGIGRRLVDHFSRTPSRCRKKTTPMRSKPAVRPCNLPNHSHHNKTICGLSLPHEKTESRKNKNSSFKWVHSIHTGSINDSHSSNFYHKFISPYFQQRQSSSTLPYKPTKPDNSSISSLKGLTFETSAFLYELV